MPAWFYILRLKSGTLYAGATTNLEHRLQEHINGQGCRTTQLDPPAALAYHEKFQTFIEARRREAQVKRWSGKKKEALAAGNKDLLCKLAASHDHQFPPAIKA